MTEWLREGIEGHSLTATLRLYLLGLMVLAPAAAVLALAFGGQVSLVATPVLVLILVGAEFAVCYWAKLRNYLQELLATLRLKSEYKFYEEPLEMRGSVVFDVIGVSIAPPEENVDELGLTGWIAFLIGALHDKEPSVRRHAVLALMETGDPVTLEPLNRVFADDEDESVRVAARDAIREIRSRALPKNRDASTPQASQSVRKRA